jgi:hypothetical protein
VTTGYASAPPPDDADPDTGRKATLARMTGSPAHDSRPSADAGAAVQPYVERLSLPLWWYGPVAVIATVLAAQFHLADTALSVWLPIAIIVPLALLGTWRMGRSQVVVQDGQLRVRHAHIPVDSTGAGVALDASTLRKVAGRYGDPAAFVMLRPWIGPGVQLLVDDPDDPTPYWLFSTRHPERVIAAVKAARTPSQ